jgi:hypothetical protein
MFFLVFFTLIRFETRSTIEEGLLWNVYNEIGRKGLFSGWIFDAYSDPMEFWK